MFSHGERDALREELLAAARADGRIDAAAIVGSAAVNREDQWSDIDLAFRVVDGLTPEKCRGRLDRANVWVPWCC
jgi:predicted nucleotidyltransferase